MYQELIRKIEAHPNYAPALRRAVAEQASLVLNYHTHGSGQPYCVAICEKPRTLLPVLGQAEPLTELVHVKGLGQTAEQCLPLMEPLREELIEHFQIQAPVQIYRDGRPLPAS